MNIKLRFNFIKYLIYYLIWIIKQQSIQEMQKQEKQQKVQRVNRSNLKESTSEPELMWSSKTNRNGFVEKYMILKYQKYFQNVLNLIEQLSETINRRWSQKEVNAYQDYLYFLSDYIHDQVLTGRIVDFNVFYDSLQSYGENTNPLGKELYQAQLDYIQSRHQKKKKEKYQHRGKNGSPRRFSAEEINQLQNEGFLNVQDKKKQNMRKLNDEAFLNQLPDLIELFGQALRKEKQNQPLDHSFIFLVQLQNYIRSYNASGQIKDPSTSLLLVL